MKIRHAVTVLGADGKCTFIFLSKTKAERAIAFLVNEEGNHKDNVIYSEVHPWGEEPV